MLLQLLLQLLLLHFCYYYYIGATTTTLLLLLQLLLLLLYWCYYYYVTAKAATITKLLLQLLIQLLLLHCCYYYYIGATTTTLLLLLQLLLQLLEQTNTRPDLGILLISRLNSLHRLLPLISHGNQKFMAAISIQSAGVRLWPSNQHSNWTRFNESFMFQYQSRRPKQQNDSHVELIDLNTPAPVHFLFFLSPKSNSNYSQRKEM